MANDQCMSFDESLRGRFGFLDRQRFRIFCAAKFFHRTNAAFGLIRHANERTQIDKRGIETRCVTFWDNKRGMVPELFAANCRLDRRAHVEQSGQNTRAICFDNWDGLIESKGRDCVRDIAPNAGQLANGRDIAGKDPAVPVLYNPRGRVKIPGATVIAEPLPGVEDIVLRSTRE